MAQYAGVWFQHSMITLTWALSYIQACVYLDTFYYFHLICSHGFYKDVFIRHAVPFGDLAEYFTKSIINPKWFLSIF